MTSSFAHRGLGSLVLLLAGSVVLSSGCSATPKGALILSISTDMQTPKDVDVVSVFIATDGVSKFDYLGRVLPDGLLSLPSTLALVQGSNPNAQVHIRVTAFQDQGGQENVRVLRDVLTTVPSQRTALLRLPLDFIDDGSGQGTLTANEVPDTDAGVPDGTTSFDPTALGSSCDPMNLCATGGAGCKTTVDGLCASAAIDSSKLPAYEGSDVFGDGGLTASGTPASCFDVQECFAQAVPVTIVNGLGTQTCSFALPAGASASTLNAALVTPSTGACLASGCYVPLPDDSSEGFTVQGSTVALAPGICNKLGSAVTLAVSSGACPSATLSDPVCEPTTPAEVAEAGLPGDATSADAMLPDAADATGPDAADASDATVSDASDATVSDAASATCGFPSLLLALAGQWSSACGSSTVTWTIAADGTYFVTNSDGQYGSGTIASDGSYTQQGGGSSGSFSANGAIALASTCDSFTDSYNVQTPPGPSVPPPYTYSCSASRACPTGTTLCGTSCVSTDSDPDNCGGCGVACTASAPFCAGGACGVDPPSCAPGGTGMTDCPGGSGTESCCTSLDVPGGTYFRTYTDDGDETTGEADPATVSSFRLDKYLVTVGRFRQFVDAVFPADGGAGWLPPAGSGLHIHLNGGQGLVSAGVTDADGGAEYETGWDSTDWNSLVQSTSSTLACSSRSSWAAGPDSLPINCVNWYEAYAFCIWDGGFLPSQAEWEYAAAGGSLQRQYPWGAPAPGTTCPGPGCDYAIYDCLYPDGSGSCLSATNIAPVGSASLGAGLWGHLDLAGDENEWLLDGYNGSVFVDPCTDCSYLNGATGRVTPGGAFYSSASNLAPLNPTLWSGPATARNDGLGFRCARQPSPAGSACGATSCQAGNYCASADAGSCAACSPTDETSTYALCFSGDGPLGQTTPFQCPSIVLTPEAPSTTFTIPITANTTGCQDPSCVNLYVVDVSAFSSGRLTVSGTTGTSGGRYADVVIDGCQTRLAYSYDIGPGGDYAIDEPFTSTKSFVVSIGGDSGSASETANTIGVTITVSGVDGGTP